MTAFRGCLSGALLSACLTLGCESGCVLDDDLRRFAGEGARDCGTAASAEERGDVDVCVANAFEAGSAFIARYRASGVDSQLINAVASNSVGAVKLFQWDSAPCGGPGCDAVTDVQSCQEPSLRAETPEDVSSLPIECGSYGSAERICP